MYTSKFISNEMFSKFIYIYKDMIRGAGPGFD